MSRIRIGIPPLTEERRKQLSKQCKGEGETAKETQNNILENLLKRSPNSYGEFESRVNDIIQNVREKRDEAIFEYTLKFDGATIDQDNICVTEEEIKEAYEQVDPKLLDVIRKALVNIRDYHAKQKQYSWFDSDESGIILGQKVTPLKTVGVYVPGGKAVYPSSVLMNVIPAKVAVDFFFMLSGFVIGYAYDDRWNRMTVGTFFKRRIIRHETLTIQYPSRRLT